MAVFTVDPSQQHELIETISAFILIAQEQSGFVAGQLLMSMDGTKVVHHTQWKSLTDYEAFTTDDRTKSQGKKLIELVGSPPDIHVYKIVAETVSEPYPQASLGCRD